MTIASRLRISQALLREPVAAEVLLRIGNVAELGEAFLLHAQRHDDVCTVDALGEVGAAHCAAEFLGLGQELLGADEAQLADVELRERLVRGARDTRVFDVADDRDAKARKVAFVPLHRHQIQQTLSRVRDIGFARVEHADVRRHLLRDSARALPCPRRELRTRQPASPAA